MKVTTKTITPAIAKAWLEKNPGNRPVTEQRVELLARDMKLGRWKLNGATIVMNCDKLIDGQHRLMAVVKSGVTIQSLVAEGVPSEVFDTIDTGKPRSAADTLAVRGEAYATNLAATLKVIDQYMTGRMEMHVRHTNWEIEQLLEKYPDARRSIRLCDNTKKLVPKSILAGCHYLFACKDAQAADELVEAVMKGKNLSEGDPLYLLRERLLQNSLAKAKLNGGYLAALIIKAWNAKRSGTTLLNLRYRQSGEKPEAFPVVQ